MGVPVITLQGNSTVGCLTTSLLHYSDCNQWISNSERDYVEIAFKLYSLGVRNQDQRLSQRNRIKQTPFGQPARLAQELEHIYRDRVITKNAP